MLVIELHGLICMAMPNVFADLLRTVDEFTSNARVVVFHVAVGTVTVEPSWYVASPLCCVDNHDSVGVA